MNVSYFYFYHLESVAKMWAWNDILLTQFIFIDLVLAGSTMKPVVLCLS